MKISMDKVLKFIFKKTTFLPSRLLLLQVSTFVAFPHSSNTLWPYFLNIKVDDHHFFPAFYWLHHGSKLDSFINFPFY